MVRSSSSYAIRLLTHATTSIILHPLARGEFRRSEGMSLDSQTEVLSQYLVGLGKTGSSSISLSTRDSAKSWVLLKFFRSPQQNSDREWIRLRFQETPSSFR